MSPCKPDLIEAGRSLLIVVDIQPPFLKALFEPERVVANSRKLIACAGICGVPVVATTQNAEKLGAMDAAIAELLPDTNPLDKMSFSCMGSDEFRSVLDGFEGRAQAVLCGLETHICINQTAHELMDAGFAVHLAADAVSSRGESDYRFGLERLRQAGAVVSVTESVIYEWLRRAGTPEFREALKWVR